MVQMKRTRLSTALGATNSHARAHLSPLVEVAMFARLIALLLVATMSLALAQSSADPVTIRMMFGNTGSAELHQRAADMFMEDHPGIRLEILEGPEQTDDLLALYADFFDTESPAVDVIQVDTIWPGFIAPHLIDLYDHLPEDVLDAHIQPIAENNLVEGRLVAIPWFADVGVLYYRTDLLEAHGFDAPPSTWEELETMATTILDAERDESPDLWGFVFQGDAYEGLTVDTLG
jgi:trehalose/maltose transport system substrate-binding protein